MLNMGLDAVRTRWVLPLDPTKLGAFTFNVCVCMYVYAHRVMDRPRQNPFYLLSHM